MGHGSMGQMGHFLLNYRDGFFGQVAVYSFMTLCAYGFTGGSWVMHNGSWVTVCMGHWVMGDPLTHCSGRERERTMSTELKSVRTGVECCPLLTV